MFSYNNEISAISSRQLGILLILDIFGTGVVVLPRLVAEYSFQDGWIAIIIATLIGLVYAYTIGSLAKAFPSQGLAEICTKILGKFLGSLVVFLYIVKILITVALELRFFSEIVRQTILPKTPSSLIIFSLISVGMLTASKGYETRARLAEFLILFMIIPLIIVFVLAGISVDYTNLLPILKTPMNGLLKGGYVAGFAFTGIEFSLMASPYINNTKKIRYVIIEATLLLGLMFLIITVITIARFGAFEIIHQGWPVLQMMDTLNIPGSFIERQEGLIISFWIISVFSLTNASLFFSSLLLRNIAKKGKFVFYIFACAVVIFVVAFIPKSLDDADKYVKLINQTVGIFFLFIIPLLLIIIAKVRKLGDW